MNFLKKKLKPFASGFSSHSQHQGHANKNLEDDLYDEYVVEAPPHPSELIALGVDPAKIDVNDPDKLRELYKKAKEEGKDKQTNSVLLAKQRQKEELEQKKRTREEWKYFESLTTRVEQAVKDSQKTLEQLKESSAVNRLTEPEYELRQTADEVFSATLAVKQEKRESEWVAFEDDSIDNNNNNKATSTKADDKANKEGIEALDEFGCPTRKTSLAGINPTSIVEQKNFIVEELFEDLGIDLRTSDQKRLDEELRKKKQKQEEEEAKKLSIKRQAEEQQQSKKNIDIKAAARPRPGANSINESQKVQEVDPFDTSFLADDKDNDCDQTQSSNSKAVASDKIEQELQANKFVDPFDTSYVNF